jgi:hypothetical protein
MSPSSFAEPTTSANKNCRSSKAGSELVTKLVKGRSSTDQSKGFLLWRGSQCQNGVAVKGSALVVILALDTDRRASGYV